MNSKHTSGFQPCLAEPCVVHDKSKEREKRLVTCNTPGCLKQFHAVCIGHAKSTEKELRKLFFVCLRCETYLNYSAEIARKSLMVTLDEKLESFKQSVFKIIDEKIDLEFAKFTKQTQSIFDDTVQQFQLKVDQVKAEAHDAVKSVALSLKDTVNRISKTEAEQQKQNELHSNQINELRVTCNSMFSEIAALDRINRRASFVVRNVPEKEFSIMGTRISTCQEAVAAISRSLGLDRELCNIKDAYRIGKMRDDGRSRLIMVKATESTAKQFLAKARLLKQSGSLFNQVYIQEDLPPFMNKKLAEMRKRAYDHRCNHPGEDAFVKGKKLIINGIIVDEVKQNF